MGYATSRRLAVEYGVRVVLGCRSEARCEKAAADIQEKIAAAGSAGSVVPLLVDLSSLDSVAAFAATLVDRYQVDMLFNNAGFVTVPHTPVNEYGLEHAFTSMHLGPFLLTERLLAARPRLRVINASSGTHHMCAIPWALPPALRRWIVAGYGPGCVDEEYLTDGVREETSAGAYFQSKAANVLHAVELPRRHPDATAAALDLGWVGTAIQPWMRGSVAPADLGWMRSVDVGIVPALHALLATEEELKVGLGLRRERAGVVVNVFGAAEEAFSYRWWRRGAEADLSAARMQERGARLWEESTRLLATLGY